MAESTTFSFRIQPPLYGLNGAELDLGATSSGVNVMARVTLVDSGMPHGWTINVGGGGSVELSGDNLGVLHNTRLDITVPGSVSAGDPDEERARLARMTNRIIDCYRFAAGRPLVRRVSRQHISYYETESNGLRGQTSIAIGPEPGEPSESAGGIDQQIVDRMRPYLPSSSGPPLWYLLYFDALADYQSGEPRSAILLANTALEVLANHGYRTAAARSMSQNEIDQVVEVEQPSVFDLLKKINAIAPTGLSNTKLTNLAAKVRSDRNAVIHGKPVPLVNANGGESLDALAELLKVVREGVAAVVEGDGEREPDST